MKVERKEWTSKKARKYYDKNRDAIVAKALVYARAHRAEAREKQSRYRADMYAFLVQLKANPCTDCGQIFPACAMDFDHVRGTKILSLHCAYSKATMLKEIAKCELVCANCHRIRTTSRRPLIARL